MEALLAELQEIFDIIILDSAPVQVSNALILGGLGRKDDLRDPPRLDDASQGVLRRQAATALWRGHRRSGLQPGGCGDAVRGLAGLDRNLPPAPTCPARSGSRPETMSASRGSYSGRAWLVARSPPLMQQGLPPGAEVSARSYPLGRGVPASMPNDLT